MYCRIKHHTKGVFQLILKNPARSESLIDELVQVWEDSVRQTHTFLTNDDILQLRPFVKKGIQMISTLLVVTEENKAAGFLGLAEQKIEMLFLSPACFGKGIGKMVLLKAIEEYGVRYVDVNEQNPNATAFYHHFGFRVFDRTEQDEQGYSFPILKMKLAEEIAQK